MSVKERLITYLKHLNISQSAFEKEVGLSNGYVNNIKQAIQPRTIQRIALRYPNLSTGWLLSGEGSMLKDDQTSVPCDQQQTYGEHPLQEQVRSLQAEICRLQNKIIELQDERSKECARLMNIIIDLQQQLLKSKGEVGGGKNGPVRSGFAETG